MSDSWEVHLTQKDPVIPVETFDELYLAERHLELFFSERACLVEPIGDDKRFTLSYWRCQEDCDLTAYSRDEIMKTRVAWIETSYESYLAEVKMLEGSIATMENACTEDRESLHAVRSLIKEHESGARQGDEKHMGRLVKRRSELVESLNRNEKCLEYYRNRYEYFQEADGR